MNSSTTTLEFIRPPLWVRPMLAQLSRINTGTLRVTTPEGSPLVFGNGGEPFAELRLLEWSALRRIFRHGDIGLAECYREGLVESSDMTALIALALKNQQELTQAIHGNRLLTLGYRLRHLFNRNSRRRSSRNISAHYDLGNDFYRLWLDPSMTYSSALFTDGYQQNLESAQEAKYERLLQMLEAKPGQKILEIGCGWGGFAEYAASRGLRVHAITLSKQQLEFCLGRISSRGLDAQVTIELTDYRDLTGTFDHIVSIEMLEAVGEQFWPTYFGRLNRLIKPGGRIAIQTITIKNDCFERYRKGTDFIQQYIFPGGMLPSPQALVEQADNAGLSIVRQHMFGRDYAETLRRWRRRFESHCCSVRELGFDLGFIRLWRFYLCYCEAGFDSGYIDVAHLLLTRER